MAKNSDKPLADFIMSLNINGLSGRVLLAPSRTSKNREILLVYDQQSSLERWEPLVRELQRYGRVSVPDLPGFGGMSSFYKIDQPAGINNLAAYLAAFIKLRYKRKSLTIVGVGFGFVVATRMLQNYPDLAKKVNLLVAIDSYAHHDDLKLSTFKRWRLGLYKRFFAMQWPAIFYRNIFLYPQVLRIRSQTSLPTGMIRLDWPEVTLEERQKAIQTNTRLWRKNDIRTFMQTSLELLLLDNCHQTVDLPLYHVITDTQARFDTFRTEQHLGVVYSKVTTVVSGVENYEAVGILPLDKPSALIPRKIRNLLARN